MFLKSRKSRRLCGVGLAAVPLDAIVFGDLLVVRHRPDRIVRLLASEPARFPSRREMVACGDASG